MKRNEVIIDEEEFYYLKSGKSKIIYLVSVYELAEIAKSFDFLFDQDLSEKQPQMYLSSRLTRNIIPPVQTCEGLWIGPADGISNLRTGEYIRAETSFYKFHETHEIQYLHKLIATLWRKPALHPSSDDPREPFDDGLVDKNAEIAARLPAEVKQAIYLFYSGCHRFLSLRFGHSNNGKSSANKDIFLQFMRMVNALSDNDVTRHEAVRQCYLMDTMITMEEMARQQEEMEKKIKSYK